MRSKDTRHSNICVWVVRVLSQSSTSVNFTHWVLTYLLDVTLLMAFRGMKSRLMVKAYAQGIRSKMQRVPVSLMTDMADMSPPLFTTCLIPVLLSNTNWVVNKPLMHLIPHKYRKFSIIPQHEYRINICSSFGDNNFICYNHVIGEPQELGTQTSYTATTPHPNAAPGWGRSFQLRQHRRQLITHLIVLWLTISNNIPALFTRWTTFQASIGLQSQLAANRSRQ